MLADPFDPTLFEYVACDFCMSEDYIVRFQPRRIPTRDELVVSVSWGERDTQRIVQCRGCGLMYVNPRPKQDLVLSHYQRNSEDHYAEQERDRLSTFRRSLQIVERYVSDKGALLDIGAAGGFFLKVAKDAGWQVAGIEPNTWLCNYAQQRMGIDITNSPLASNSFRPDSFDAITLWDVIEHVHEPSNVLSIARDWLKKDGVIVLSTPNAASTLARIFGRRWWFYLSVHLFYFTPEILARRMEDLGFRVLATRRYFQTLSLGHLVRMFSMYSLPVSSLADRLLASTRLARVPIRYYASQFSLVARKL